jgi:hypothetical protein
METRKGAPKHKINFITKHDQVIATYKGGNWSFVGSRLRSKLCLLSERGFLKPVIEVPKVIICVCLRTLLKIVKVVSRPTVRIVRCRD